MIYLYSGVPPILYKSSCNVNIEAAIKCWRDYLSNELPPNAKDHVYYEDIIRNQFVQVYPEIKELSPSEVTYLKLCSTIQTLT